MTAKTANRGYVYPITTDRPLDAPVTIAQMVTTQLEPDLVFLDSEYRRTKDFPFAFVECNNGATLASLDYIPWDTVVEDTWGFVDLGRDALNVALTVPGRYLFGAYAVGGGVGGTAFDIPFELIIEGEFGTDSNYNPNVGRTNGMTWAVKDNYDSDPYDIGCQVSFAGTNTAPTVALTYAAMWGVWVRDY